MALLAIVFAVAPIAADGKKPSGLAVDKEKKTVTIDAKVAPRKLAHLEQSYPIEVIACWAHPKGKKAHETIVTIDVNPSDVHKAIESLGAMPGKPAKGEGTAAEGPEIAVFIDIPQPGGSAKLGKADTICLCVVDKDRNCVSLIQSNYFGFGWG